MHSSPAMPMTGCSEILRNENFPGIRGITSDGRLITHPPGLSTEFGLRPISTVLDEELNRRFELLRQEFFPDETVSPYATPRELENMIGEQEMLIALQDPENAEALQLAADPFYSLLRHVTRLREATSERVLLQEVSERQSFFDQAIAELKQGPPARIHVLCDVTYGAGTYGTGLLIAEEIAARLPSSLVRIGARYDNASTKNFALADLNHPRVTTFNRSSSLWKELSHHEIPDLVIRIQPADHDRTSNQHEVMLGTMPAELVTPHYNPFCITLNAESSFASLPLSVSIHQRRKNAQTWSASERIAARISFLEQALPEATQHNLSLLASERGFSPESSIWSWGYFQDAQNVVAEIAGLANVLHDDPSFFEKTMTESGKQIVYFLTAGEAGWARDYIFHLHDQGVALITEDGICVSPTGRSVPITIVLTKGFPRTVLNELQSELLGSMVRDKQDKFWIDFPVICTGNASWLEVLSAGGLWAHDGFDAQNGGFKYVLSALLEKLFTIKDQSENTERNRVKARKLQESCLLGSPGRDIRKVYSDLEKKTRLGIGLTAAAHQIAMGKDIIRLIAWLRKHPPSGHEEKW